MRETFEREMTARHPTFNLRRDRDGYADEDTDAMWAGFCLAQELLLVVCERALNYASNVAQAEGVYFDDDSDLPFIESVVKSAKGGNA